MALLGGAVGFSLQYFLDPVYEAGAQLTMYVDAAQTGSLTDYEVDYVYQAAGQVISFDPIISWVVERARQEIPLQITEQQFRQRMRLERRHETWVFYIRHTDPELTAALANLWAEEAYRWLAVSRDHARRALVLQDYLEALEDCPEPPAFDPPLPSICSLQAAPDDQAVEALLQQLEHEMALSYSVSAALLLSEPELADIPAQPVRRSSAGLIFSSAMFGFAAGMLLSTLPYSPRMV